MKPPKNIVGCESCKFRKGNFHNDIKFKEIIRCYCTARHIQVDAEQMSKLCDFFAIDPARKPKEDRTRGL